VHFVKNQSSRGATAGPADGAAAILMYHDIASRPVSRAFGRYVVAPTLFAEQLDALVEVADVVSLGGAVTCPTTGARGVGARRQVVLTFDDALHSFAAEAMPRLLERSMAATVFVPTAFAGGRADWLAPVGADRLRVLDWAALAECGAAGAVVGSHGHRHLELDAVGRAVAADDLHRSRALVVAEVGTDQPPLAYPFGYHDRAVRALAREAGYRLACEVGYGLQPRCGDPLRIRRILVGPRTSPEMLRHLVVEGATSTVEHVRRATRGPWRAYRRLRAVAVPTPETVPTAAGRGPGGGASPS
jgi:peptidoglycan/xylan/chitin deacetylase (PgdA/CDA1 family)